MDSASARNSGKTRPLTQNRRQGDRHRLHIHAILTPEADNPREIPVVVTEMSVGGIGFRCLHLLQIGAIYRLSSFDTLIPHNTRASIVTQRQLADGRYEIGAKTLADARDNHA